MYATGISAGSARLTVEVPVQNERAAGADAEVTIEVLGEDGKSVAQMKESGQAPRLATGN